LKLEWQAWWRLPRQLRFLVVGGYNTIFGYLVFSGLFLVLGRWVHYLVIGCFAHAIAVINAFVAHRCLVFRSLDRWQPSFFRFCLSQLVAFAFGLAGLYGLVEFAHFNPLLAQAVVTVSSVLLTYALHRYFSFRDPSNGGPSE
jgi:putative flippase GtrA